MRHTVLFLVLLISLEGCQDKPQSDRVELKTICNPIDISYRFSAEAPSRREAADPTMVWFKDRYFLFASKSSGYWHSQDLADWSFIETSEIPSEEYAPTVIAVGDTLYFLASSQEKSTIYKSSNPLAGTWSVAVEQLETPVWDPAFFMDDDKRMFLYWGCSNKNPIYGVEVDYKNNFSFVGKPQELLHANPANYGWEVPGDSNTLVNQSPWIEGAWMNKHNGKYYLQYSGPGTEYSSYSDAVYVSTSPLGPFAVQPHNPFAYKPGGFATAAGHGSTFADAYGNFWHIGTMTISQKHMFERRLGLFPSFFDDKGTLYSITKYGDYPFIIPQKKISSFEDIFPGWMLLSYGKKVEVSSYVDSLPAANIVDENIRTYWAAKSGGANEYATLDMGESFDVYAVQINFAEHNTSLLGRNNNVYHRYKIEHSSDGHKWDLLVDQSKNDSDKSHDYIQLPEKVSCRFLKVTNIEVPGGHFAMSGFRAFGKGSGAAPEKVSSLKAVGNPQDKRRVTLTWDKSSHATGYNISFGVDKNMLYQNYMVYGDNTLTINSLDSNQDYYFAIESFNENGIARGEQVVKAE